MTTSENFDTVESLSDHVLQKVWESFKLKKKRRSAVSLKMSWRANQEQETILRQSDLYVQPHKIYVHVYECHNYNTKTVENGIHGKLW